MPVWLLILCILGGCYVAYMLAIFAIFLVGVYFVWKESK